MELCVTDRKGEDNKISTFQPFTSLRFSSSSLWHVSILSLFWFLEHPLCDVRLLLAYFINNIEDGKVHTRVYCHLVYVP